RPPPHCQGRCSPIMRHIHGAHWLPTREACWGLYGPRPLAATGGLPDATTFPTTGTRTRPQWRWHLRISYLSSSPARRADRREEAHSAITRPRRLWFPTPPSPAPLDGGYDGRDCGAPI